MFKIKKSRINEYLESFDRDQNLKSEYQTKKSNQYKNKISNAKNKKPSTKQKHKRKNSEHLYNKIRGFDPNIKEYKKKKHLSIDVGKYNMNIPISLQW